MATPDTFLILRGDDTAEVFTGPFAALAAGMGVPLRPCGQPWTEWATTDGDTSVIRLPGGEFCTAAPTEGASRG